MLLVNGLDPKRSKLDKHFIANITNEDIAGNFSRLLRNGGFLSLCQKQKKSKH